jgi:hypothetical protein
VNIQETLQTLIAWATAGIQSTTTLAFNLKPKAVCHGSGFFRHLLP